MSAAKHTPGPWGRIVELGCDVYAISKDPESHTFVAECAIEEDARFIAAAPAMYEALKQTFNVMENILTDSQLDTRTPCGLTIREWESKVRIALAQAEGK